MMKDTNFIFYESQQTPSILIFDHLSSGLNVWNYSLKGQVKYTSKLSTAWMDFDDEDKL